MIVLQLGGDQGYLVLPGLPGDREQVLAALHQGIHVGADGPIVPGDAPGAGDEEVLGLHVPAYLGGDPGGDGQAGHGHAHLGGEQGLGLGFPGDGRSLDHQGASEELERQGLVAHVDVHQDLERRFGYQGLQSFRYHPGELADRVHEDVVQVDQILVDESRYVPQRLRQLRGRSAHRLHQLPEGFYERLEHLQQDVPDIGPDGAAGFVDHAFEGPSGCDGHLRGGVHLEPSLDGRRCRTHRLRQGAGSRHFVFHPSADLYPERGGVRRALVLPESDGMDSLGAVHDHDRGFRGYLQREGLDDLASRGIGQMERLRSRQVHDAAVGVQGIHLQDLLHHDVRRILHGDEDVQQAQAVGADGRQRLLDDAPVAALHLLQRRYPGEVGVHRRAVRRQRLRHVR